MRTLEGTAALRQEQGIVRLVLSLFWPLITLSALSALVLLVHARPAVLGTLVVPLLAIPAVLGIVVISGILALRIQSTAQGLNEFPALTGSNLAACFREGLRGGLVLTWCLLPIAALAVLLARVLGLADGLLPQVPVLLSASRPAGLAVGVSGVLLLLLAVSALPPIVLVQSSVLHSLVAALDPVSLFRHLRRASRDYLAAVSLTLAGESVFILAAALFTALGLGMQGTPAASLGWMVMVVGDAFCLLLLVVFLLVFSTDWLGQYAYTAYADDIEHLVIHEEIDPLTPEEEAMLPEGTVAWLRRGNGPAVPVDYAAGEYRFPAMQNKSVSRRVLRQLDSEKMMEWQDPMHRRNVMND